MCPKKRQQAKMSKQNSTLSMARMRFSSYQLVLTEIKSWKQIENIFTKNQAHCFFLFLLGWYQGL
ncbi:hypothetical protein CH359_19620 [Leptospira meyeri]|nr:hypothetical protein CH359_19620 [Leptospira meyeri]PJZ94950.1 hypothetical protein CH358_19685 [Leptospira meyeri]